MFFVTLPFWRVCAVQGIHAKARKEEKARKAAAIFGALFARNPLRRVLRFLDESSTPLEELQLIATLPPRPFLQALARS